MRLEGSRAKVRIDPVAPVLIAGTEPVAAEPLLLLNARAFPVEARVLEVGLALVDLAGPAAAVGLAPFIGSSIEIPVVASTSRAPFAGEPAAPFVSATGTAGATVGAEVMLGALARIGGAAAGAAIGGASGSALAGVACEAGFAGAAARGGATVAIAGPSPLGIPSLAARSEDLWVSLAASVSTGGARVGTGGASASSARSSSPASELLHASAAVGWDFGAGGVPGVLFPGAATAATSGKSSNSRMSSIACGERSTPVAGAAGAAARGEAVAVAGGAKVDDGTKTGGGATGSLLLVAGLIGAAGAGFAIGGDGGAETVGTGDALCAVGAAGRAGASREGASSRAGWPIGPPTERPAKESPAGTTERPAKESPAGTGPPIPAFAGGSALLVPFELERSSTATFCMIVRTGGLTILSRTPSPTDLMSARIMATPTRSPCGARTGRQTATRPSSRPIS